MSFLGLTEWANEQGHKTIADRVEETFGPNPCTTLRLQTDEGDLLELTCDRKHCQDCGKHKQLTMQLQLQATFGANAYIGRTHNRETLDRALAAVKKACQRSGVTFDYQIAGDTYNGFIVVSDIQIVPEQKRMNLSSWMKRILNAYKYGQRLRRTRAIGRMSLVPLRRKGNSGQPSPWRRRTFDSEAFAEVEDVDWDFELHRIYDLQDWTYQTDPELADPWTF